MPEGQRTSADNRTPAETLALFVAGGNLRDAEPSPKIPADRVKLIKQRQEAILQGKGTPAAGDTPSDFRSAVAEKEQEADERERKSRGADIPGRNRFANHPVLKHIYRAHDAISSLPAPGGLAAMIVAIFILWLFLIPVTSKGETRANLLWDVLMGTKTLPGATITQAVGGISDASAKAMLDFILSQLFGGAANVPTLTTAQSQACLQIIEALQNQGLTSDQIQSQATAQIAAYLQSQGIPTTASGQGMSTNVAGYYNLEPSYYAEGDEYGYY